MKKHESAIILKAKPSVQVYDLRSTARVMTTLPFSAGPALLRFHPRYSGTLLIASTSGAFTLSQTPATSYTPIVQVSGRRSPDLSWSVAEIHAPAGESTAIPCMHTPS